jgi:hypothetical protein
MWFRRLSRRRRQPPPVLLPSLERLAELIGRVVELLDEVAVGPAPERAARAPNLSPNPGPNPGPSADGHLLLVPSPDGYRLLEREGPPPARGDMLEMDEVAYCVLRLGLSPLPGDRRGCAYLERQEPPKADRTFDR